MAYEIGDGIRVSVVFTDAVNGALVNPSVVTLTLQLPDGTEPAVTVHNPTTGAYHADYVVSQPGVHWYRWAATGSYPAASEGNFVVSRSHFDV